MAGYRVPDKPTIAGSVRAAGVDFYFNSWRLVPANVLWGVGLLLLIGGLAWWPPVALPLAAVLALPAAGIYRLAALIVRAEPVSFVDALVAWRHFFGTALVVGFALTAISAVLATNLIVGLASLTPLGWVVGTLAGWALLATSLVALALWPLLVDPLRETESLRRRVTLAIQLVLVAPLRFAALLAIVALVLVTSTVFFAALITISVAFVALLSTRYVLAAADRLEGRPTVAIAD